MKLFLKIILTLLALYLAFRQVDLDQLSQIVQGIKWFWLVPAFACFLLSKLVAAFRLQAFFSSTGLLLDTVYNIRLYLVGMFYNIFLPGGIGGDGYKVFQLKNAAGAKVKPLIIASLLDRLGGLAAICFLAFFAGIFSNFYLSLDKFRWVFWAGMSLAFPTYYFIVRWFFASFSHIVGKSILLSILLQLFISGTVVFILLALGVEQYFIEYYSLFMIATIAATLPLTIGGIGIREAVLVYLPGIVSTDVSQNTAVALSLIFLVITLLTSFAGAFIDLEQPRLKVAATANKEA